jgi:putative Mn2+ efflux pump MntP
MRRLALTSLLFGALILGAFVLALLQGRSTPVSSLVLLILGGGMLATSIRILLPSYRPKFDGQLRRFEAMTEAERVRMFRKQLLVVAIVLLVEIPVAVLAWSNVEWQRWITAAIGTTVLLFLIILGVIIRRRRFSLN